MTTPAHLPDPDIRRTWRVDRPGAEPRFYATEAEARTEAALIEAQVRAGRPVAHQHLPVDVVVWEDPWDYAGYNEGAA